MATSIIIKAFLLVSGISLALGADYVIKKTGRCTTLGKEECKRIAGSNAATYFEENYDHVPHGCYKYALEGKFYFNTHTGKDCGTGGDECYCQKDGWHKWSAWTPCIRDWSKTCKVGKKARGRVCDTPICTGLDGKIVKNDAEVQWKRCVYKKCPVDGGWNNWGAWGECGEGNRNDSCKNGNQARFRHCINPPVENGGKDCTGPDMEWQRCDATSVCPKTVSVELVTSGRCPSGGELTARQCEDLAIWEGKGFSARNNDDYPSKGIRKAPPACQKDKFSGDYYFNTGTNPGDCYDVSRCVCKKQ